MREYGYTKVQTIPLNISYESFWRIAKEERNQIIGTHECMDHLVNDVGYALKTKNHLAQQIWGLLHKQMA